jgi:hypothetical protein
MSNLEKYICRDVLAPAEKTQRMAEYLTMPALELNGAKCFGNHNLKFTWTPVHKAFMMEKEPHQHDNDQFLIFVGSDPNNLLDLGGEVELTLSEDGKNFEKFVFTKATFVSVPRGLYHCPLNFKKINDPMKPIMFHDFYLGEYRRV